MAIDTRNEHAEQYREWEALRAEYERLAMACVRERAYAPVLLLTVWDDGFLKACGVKVW